MKRPVLLVVVGIACIVVGCGSVQWSIDFTDRLEAASQAMQETLETVGPGESKAHDFAAFRYLGKELLSMGEAMKELDAPNGCEVVQEKGVDQVKRFGGTGEFVGEPKNFTPVEFGNMRESIGKDIDILDRIAGEAKVCEGQ